MLKNNFSMRLIVALAMLTFLSIMSAQAFCQSPDGSLVGTVKDPQNKVVTGATVTLKSTSTDTEKQAKTDASGRYTFLGVPTGSYQLTVDAKGFDKWTKEGIQISAASQLPIDIVLGIGRVDGGSTTVKGNAITEAITARGTNVVEVIDQKYLTELPIQTQNAVDMVHMLGGVVSAPGAAAGLDQGNTMIMGTPASGVQVIRDGINVNEVRWNTGFQTPSHVNPDVVEEFKVVL